MAEVDEQPDLDAGGAQVVHELRPMLIDQGADRLDFDDDRTETNKVRPKDLFQCPALIAQANLLLCQELNALAGQLQFKALLIHGLDEPATLFLIDFKTCPKNLMRFLFQDQFTHGSFLFPCVPSVPWFTPSGQDRSTAE